MTELRRRILSGELPPGTRLREEALAEEFTQSRHTIRRALDRLVAERLLAAEAYRGVSVALLTDRDVVELQQMRGALESEAVRLIVQEHGTTWPVELLAPIEGALAKLADAAREDRDVERAHSRFHQTLVAAAGNSRIAKAYDGLNSEMLLFLHQLRQHYARETLAEDHRRYLETAMLRGEIAVHEHLDQSTDLMIVTRHL